MVISRSWLRRGAATTVAAVAAGATLVALGAGAGSAEVTASAAAASSRPAGKITVLVYGDAQNSVEKWAVAQYNKTAEGKKVKAVFQSIPEPTIRPSSRRS